MLIVPNVRLPPPVPAPQPEIAESLTCHALRMKAVMESSPPAPIVEAARRSPGSARWSIRAVGGSPIWQDGTLYFFFVGDAESVTLKHWLDIFPEIPPFRRLDETSLWWTHVDVPPDARFDYRLAVVKMGKVRSVRDPLNKQESSNPFGANSQASGPAYSAPPWTRSDPDVAGGELRDIEVDSAIYGGRAVVPCYVPISAAPDMPLLMVHDGSDYAIHASIVTVLDNLIATGLIPPVAAIFSDPDTRTTEYAADLHHANFVVQELLPGVEEMLGLEAGRRVAVGASLGGVAALHAAWTHPGVFSGLVLQSGSFVRAMGGPHKRGPVFAPVVRWMDQFMADPGDLPSKIHMSCGQFDGLIDDNRRLSAFLRDRGTAIDYTDAPDGHDWTYWRNDLGPALSHVLSSA